MLALGKASLYAAWVCKRLIDERLCCAKILELDLAKTYIGVSLCRVHSIAAPKSWQDDEVGSILLSKSIVF